MSTDRNAPSSDLAQAARLAATLTAPAEGPRRAGQLVPPPPGPVAPSYVRLRAEVRPPPAPPSPDAFGAAAWNELLDWSLTLAGGGAAVLTDRHGLVVAWRGPIARDEVERLGTELAGVLDATRRVRGPGDTPVAAIELDAGAVHVTVALGEHGYALALVGRHDLGREARETLVSALARATEGA